MRKKYRDKKTNKKQTKININVEFKNEIIQQVKEEILKEYIQNGKPTIKMVAYYDELLAQVENSQTQRSAITSNIKFVIKLFLSIFIILLVISCMVIVWLSFQKNRFDMLWYLLGLIPIAFMMVCLHINEVNILSKSDAYNMLIFIITIISFAITIATIL